MKDFSVGKLIKVTNYSDNLMKGELYCNNIGLFRKAGKEGMYDPEEGCIRIHCYESSDIPGKAWKSTFKLEVNADDLYVFCMTCLIPRKTNNKINKGVYQFTTEQNEKFSEFGADTVTIDDTTKFMKRLKAKCDEKGIKYAYSDVKYGDRTLESIRKELGEKWKEIPLPIVACFCKPVEYKWQQEYRFIFWNVPEGEIKRDKNNEKYIDLQIGSIEDIAFMCKDVFPNFDKNKGSLSNVGVPFKSIHH